MTVYASVVVSIRLDSKKLLRGTCHMAAKWPLLGGKITSYRLIGVPTRPQMDAENVEDFALVFATGIMVDF